jgi:hypothetical protein
VEKEVFATVFRGDETELFLVQSFDLSLHFFVLNG